MVSELKQLRRFYEFRIVYPLLKQNFQAYSIWPDEMEDKRGLKAYCIGLPRSGTHTINNIFKKKYSSRHEPLAGGDRIEILNGSKCEKLSLKRYLANRDRYLRLNLESSHYLIHFIECLVDLFPERKYLLTIRNPRDWVLSLLRQIFPMVMKGQKKTGWLLYYSFIFKTDLKEMKFRDESDLHFLICNMLNYYEWHVNLAKDQVPKENLLLINTYQMFGMSETVTDFLGIPEFKFERKIVSKSSSSYDIKLPLLSENAIDQFRKNYFKDVLNRGNVG